MTSMQDADATTEERAKVNRLIGYHSEISRLMTAERTSLESGLIPVTAYILVAAAESFMRYPDMIPTIDRALSADEIGRRGRRPGSRVNSVHLWSIANIPLVGRKFLTAFQLADDRPGRLLTALDFWERAALGFRSDGTRQAWDSDLASRPYDDDVIGTLVAGARALGEEERNAVKRFNATLMAYLFLLYFDTRVGTGDTGPWPLPDGRTLIVRDFYEITGGDFPWRDAAADFPYRNLTAALVLDGVRAKVNDWGTSTTDPEDYLDRLAGFGLFTTDSGSLEAVLIDELPALTDRLRHGQRALYRRIAAMSRAEKIACGAHVYFGFLRPFARVAGVADNLDWTVPRDTLGGIYEMLEPIEGANTGGMEPPPYYLPYPD